MSRGGLAASAVGLGKELAEGRMRSRFALAAALFAAGCTSQLSYDLGMAEDACHARTWPTKAALAACLTARERPVWAKDEPQTLDLYDGFAAARGELAQAFDRGALSGDQYSDRLDQLAQDFHARIMARRQAEKTR
jgi:hypothetical protein